MLPQAFFERTNVVQIARELLGKTLNLKSEQTYFKLYISETEAYEGVTDRASHAYAGKRTKRTEVLYQEGGRLYVYLIYGMYHMLNIVTNAREIPHAVLIRAAIPLEGTDKMEENMGRKVQSNTLNGPGKLCKAMGIDKYWHGRKLTKGGLWISDERIQITENEIEAGPRIGIDYAGKDARLPYRFVWKQKKPLC